MLASHAHLKASSCKFPERVHKIGDEHVFSRPTAIVFYEDDVLIHYLLNRLDDGWSPLSSFLDNHSCSNDDLLQDALFLQERFNLFDQAVD